MKSNNNYPTRPNPGGAYQPKKQGFLGKVRDRFKEKPATKEEIKQLRLNTQREELKTRKVIAKTKRPSRFNNIFGGESRPAPSYRKSSRYAPQDSGLFGGNSSSGGGGWLMDESWNPSFSMFTGGEKKKGKNQKSGLEELF